MELFDVVALVPSARGIQTAVNATSYYTKTRKFIFLLATSEHIKTSDAGHVHEIWSFVVPEGKQDKIEQELKLEKQGLQIKPWGVPEIEYKFTSKKETVSLKVSKNDRLYLVEPCLHHTVASEQLKNLQSYLSQKFSVQIKRKDVEVIVPLTLVLQNGEKYIYAANFSARDCQSRHQNNNISLDGTFIADKVIVGNNLNDNSQKKVPVPEKKKNCFNRICEKTIGFFKRLFNKIRQGLRSLFGC